MAGASCDDSIRRMIWRIESVDNIRPIPNRWATSSANDVLPTPAVPPNKMMTGRSGSWYLRQTR